VLIGRPHGNQITVEDGTVLIGRHEDNHVLLFDAEVSEVHAALVWRAGGWYVVDLGSGSGTWVDGQRVDAPTSVRAGNTIQFGNSVYEVRRPQPTAGSRAGPRGPPPPDLSSRAQQPSSDRLPTAEPPPAGGPP
jgi:pSer/pThr/pTyr-binding forkhead associated (FHA) protein